MSAQPIPKRLARPFRIARVVFCVASLGFVVAGPLGSSWLAGVAFAIAAVSLLVAYAWRCPVCGKSFALKFSLPVVGMPFTNTCVRCGSRLR